MRRFAIHAEVAAVLSDTTLHPFAKLAFVAVAMLYPRGTPCFTLAEIAESAGLSESRTRDGLRWLADAGLIEKEKVKGQAFRFMYSYIPPARRPKGGIS